MLYRSGQQRPEGNTNPEQRMLPADAKKLTTLRSESVIEKWNTIVLNGAGYSQSVIDTVMGLIKESNIPEFTIEIMDVATGTLGAFMGKQRAFLVVTHSRLRDYKMYISARDFGAHLDVSWFLTCEPGFLKRAISKYTSGNPQALSMSIDLFDQQDLSAYVGIAHHYVTETAQKVMEELKQDPTGLNTKSKGFLELW